MKNFQLARPGPARGDDAPSSSKTATPNIRSIRLATVPNRVSQLCRCRRFRRGRGGADRFHVHQARRVQADDGEIPFSELRAGWPAEPPQAHLHWLFFDCMVDPNSGRYLSEDYAFCRRGRHGGKIWVDLWCELSISDSTIMAEIWPKAYGCRAGGDCCASVARSHRCKFDRRPAEPNEGFSASSRQPARCSLDTSSGSTRNPAGSAGLAAHRAAWGSFIDGGPCDDGIVPLFCPTCQMGS